MNLTFKIVKYEKSDTKGCILLVKYITFKKKGNSRGTVLVRGKKRGQHSKTSGKLHSIS